MPHFASKITNRGNFVFPSPKLMQIFYKEFARSFFSVKQFCPSNFTLYALYIVVIQIVEELLDTQRGASFIRAFKKDVRWEAARVPYKGTMLYASSHFLENPAKNKLK